MLKIRGFSNHPNVFVVNNIQSRDRSPKSLLEVCKISTKMKGPTRFSKIKKIVLFFWGKYKNLKVTFDNICLDRKKGFEIDNEIEL